jgi:simple sugar transport system permease protein
MTPMEKFLLAIMAIYILVVATQSAKFFSLETAFDLIRNGSGAMILALGCLIVLISGGLDVSFTAIAIVGGYSSVLMSRALGVDNLFLIISAAIVIGALLGSINALIIHYFQLSTLIATLGTASVFHGVMVIVLGSKTFTRADVPQSMLDFGALSIITIKEETSQYGLTIFFPVVVAVGVLTWFLAATRSPHHELESTFSALDYSSICMSVRYPG